MLTPADLDTLIARYEAMAAAARANDWDTLAALEREAAALRNRVMQRSAGQTLAASKLPASAQALLARGIERVLALDAEIRSHTDPFLASVRKLLSADARENAVRSAYGALER